MLNGVPRHSIKHIGFLRHTVLGVIECGKDVLFKYLIIIFVIFLVTLLLAK